jgi:hypothetical protein
MIFKPRKPLQVSAGPKNVAWPVQPRGSVSTGVASKDVGGGVATPTQREEESRYASLPDEAGPHVGGGVATPTRSDPADEAAAPEAKAKFRVVKVEKNVAGGVASRTKKGPTYLRR